MDSITLGLMFFTSVLVYAYYRFAKKFLNVPPCPVRPLPIVGHLLTLKADQRPQFKKWREQCGDIFSVYLGSKLLVVINDFDLIKETFVKRAEEFSDRPVMFIDEIFPREKNTELHYKSLHVTMSFNQAVTRIF
ncbi:cytochrome P450 II f2-like protein II [Biomphalaria pfeifferi]|uniref:Cytochrome P450 II f2-like protein II n=1 Tax=Biomphalaria pfeifferi TaxID=112525 RepID=A0AAD8FF21_BIOPF|nr:cytochrome P450 II f2-like protein II [Biomphalaria pfeifferi]